MHDTICSVACQYILSRDIMSSSPYLNDMSKEAEELAQGRADRLRRARIEAGFTEPTEFARKHKLVEPTYLAHERGARFFKYHTAIQYAQMTGKPIDWIWSGNARESSVTVPLIGKTQKDGRIEAAYPLTGKLIMLEAQEKPRMVEAPPNADSAELLAIEIGDNRFSPYIKPGAIIYYSSIPDDIKHCIGEVCVIQIKGGIAVVDILQRGEKHALFDTHHSGHGLEIEWCARIRWVRAA